MADWESLKSLRIHRNIMRIVVLLMIGLLAYNFVKKNSKKSRTSSKTNTLKPSVNAVSGLNIRENSYKNSKALISVPYNEHITILDKSGKTDYVNGQTGTWYKVEYEGIIGYAWSELISE